MSPQFRFLRWFLLCSVVLAGWGGLDGWAQTDAGPVLEGLQRVGSGPVATGRTIAFKYSATASVGTIRTVVFNFNGPFPGNTLALRDDVGSGTVSSLFLSNLPSGNYTLQNITVTQSNGASSTYFRSGALTHSALGVGPYTHSLSLALGDFVGAYTTINTVPVLSFVRLASAGTLTGGSSVEVSYGVSGNGGGVGAVRLRYLDPAGEPLELVSSGPLAVATAVLPKTAASGTYTLDTVTAYSAENSSVYATFLRDGSVLRTPSGLEGWPTHFAKFSEVDFTVVAATGPVAAPVLNTQPRSQTVAYYAPLNLSVVASGSYVGYQWYKNGEVIFGEYGSALSRAMAIETDSAVYQVVVKNAGGAVTSAGAVVIVSHPAGPVIAVQPASMNVVAGQPASFSVGVTSASPALKYQWLRDGQAIVGATNASYSVPSASAAAVGDYSVIVINNTGAVLSQAAALRTYVPAAPVITAQSAALGVTVGQPVALAVTVTGSPAPSLQWRKDGVPLAGATANTLTIAAAKLDDAGAYSLVATNASGSVTSTAVRVTVALPIINPARLVNLSINTTLVAGETMTLGTVVGGADPRGTKPLLIRGMGPSLAAFGVPGFLPDPRLDLYAGQQVVAANDNWGGSPSLAAAASSVGAFAFAGTGSADAAIYEKALPAEAYTVQVKGVGSSAGIVLAEVYDATPAETFTAATPRLINVSVLKQIRTGESVTAGFVIDGTGSATVLVRAVAPSLGQLFGVGGAMNDPKLTVYSGQTLVAANDNWAVQATGSASAIIAAADAVGAFRLPDAASKDAVLLLTLRPGSYTAVVSSADGPGGLVITEIYEVP